MMLSYEGVEKEDWILDFCQEKSKEVDGAKGGLPKPSCYPRRTLPFQPQG